MCVNTAVPVKTATWFALVVRWLCKPIDTSAIHPKLSRAVVSALEHGLVRFMARLKSASEWCLAMLASVLGVLFPPYLPTVDMDEDIDHDTVDDSGIVWRAYDVRQTGIEKHFKKETL